MTPLDAHRHGTASVCSPFSVASSLRSLVRGGESGGEERRRGREEREGREGRGKEREVERGERR